MARRSVTGQLNMFELLNSLDNESAGEVEMVSLMPSFEEEPVEEPVVEEISIQEESSTVEITSNEKHSTEIQVETDKPVMSRTYEVDGEKIEVAYLNYNKVRITRGSKMSEVKVFSSSKEAVDYYVLMMKEWEKDEE